MVLAQELKKGLKVVEKHLGQKREDEAEGSLWLLHEQIWFSHAKAQGTIPTKIFLKVLSSEEDPETLLDHRGPLVVQTDSPLACSGREVLLHCETADVLWLFPLLAEKSIPSLSMASAERHRHCVTHCHFRGADRLP